jgi:hypothetical protein
LEEAHIRGMGRDALMYQLKDLVVLHAMAHIYHPKLASGLIVTLLQEECDIFNFK